MNDYPEKFIRKTIETWQPYSPRKLSKKDAIEITENLTRFFDLLLEIDKQGKEENNS